MRKKIELVILFLSLNLISLSAQNLIPLSWTLSFGNESIPKEISNINMLLSWERQGFSYLNTLGELRTEFQISQLDTCENFTLEISLRLDVQGILINEKYIGGNISNEFIWSPNPNYKTSKFLVPASYLHFNKENTIAIRVSNFSYTGGKSHNLVRLYTGEELQEPTIQLNFESPEHLFRENEELQFSVDTETDSDGLLNVLLRNDFMDTICSRNIQVKKGFTSTKIDLSNENLLPGFYEVIASLKNEGYAGIVEWFTVSPTKIEDSTTAPHDFDEFWNAALNELSLVKADFKMSKADHLCTEKRDAYIVEMHSIDSALIRGYYFAPKKKGTYAAILNLPGYGYDFEHLDEFLSNQEDVIELALCVRGHGISKDAFTPDSGTGFMGHQIGNKEKSAYRKIYMDCIRAVEFLMFRDEVDKTKIGVFGGSQGGGLALMSAGLANKHISACAYFDPFPCDLKNHIRIRKMLKGEINNFLACYNHSYTFADALNTLEYLDAKHFAEKIKAPTLYLTGLFDDDCPSRLGFSAYNKIKALKEFKIFPNDSHIGESNYKKEAMKFFKKQFGY